MYNVSETVQHKVTSIIINLYIYAAYPLQRSLQSKRERTVRRSRFFVPSLFSVSSANPPSGFQNESSLPKNCQASAVLRKTVNESTRFFPYSFPYPPGRNSAKKIFT
jgi:hypothetical protein